MPRYPKIIPAPESRAQLAVRLYDTSEPPLTLTECARLAGIRPQTLRTTLLRRVHYETVRCPHCHQLPRKPWTARPIDRDDLTPPHTTD